MIKHKKSPSSVTSTGRTEEKLSVPIIPQAMNIFDGDQATKCEYAEELRKRVVIEDLLPGERSPC